MLRTCGASLSHLFGLHSPGDGGASCVNGAAIVPVFRCEMYLLPLLVSDGFMWEDLLLFHFMWQRNSIEEKGAQGGVPSQVSPMKKPINVAWIQYYNKIRNWASTTDRKFLLFIVGAFRSPGWIVYSQSIRCDDNRTCRIIHLFCALSKHPRAVQQGEDGQTDGLPGRDETNSQNQINAVTKTRITTYY